MKIVKYVAGMVSAALWPETCPFCGKVSRQGMCTECEGLVADLFVREPRCMRCGKPVRYKDQEYCQDCMHTHHYYDRGMGVWLHKYPVNASIYRFKYHNQRTYAGFYAKVIAVRYGAVIRRWNPQVIVPVPIHKSRRKKRGYNQAELLAKELGACLKVPVESHLVRRVLHTNPQKQYDHRMRKKNLEHAFAPGYLQNRRTSGLRRVLVVDDIYTTGNTVDQVSKILKDMGVQKVYFLTISIGQGY